MGWITLLGNVSSIIAFLWRLEEPAESIFGYPPIPPTSLPTEQHRFNDEASEICSSVLRHRAFYRNEDGLFIGPFLPLLYTPGHIALFSEFVAEQGKLPGFGLSVRDRQSRNRKYYLDHISTVRSWRALLHQQALRLLRSKAWRVGRSSRGCS